MSYSLFPEFETAPLQRELNDSFEAWVMQRARSTSKDRAEKALREETVAVYREMWHAFAGYCGERKLLLQEIQVEELELFLRLRGAGEEGRKPRVTTKGEDLSPRYARRFLTLIDRVTRFAARQADVNANCAAHELLQRPYYRFADAADKDPLPEYLPDSDAKRLIAYVTQIRGSDSAPEPLSWKEIRDRTAVAVMLGGGLAPGDVRALQLNGVITSGGRKATIPWKLEVPGNGNSPARETPLAEWAGRQLHYWLTVRTEQGIPGDVVFPSTSSGRAWSHTRCFESCKAVMVAAGLPTDSGGLFKLRHTFALRQLAKGKSEVDVGRWLGLLDLNGMARYRRIVPHRVDVV
jgi:site-specific recombinase XerD